MLEFIKNLFRNPKDLIRRAIDALDLFVYPLANEIDKIKERFNAMDSQEKSQWTIDKVQAWLRKRFGITEP